MEPALETLAAPLPLPSRPEFSVGRVVSRTFSIWWGNVVVFGTVAVIINLPAIALSFAEIGQKVPRGSPGVAMLGWFLQSVLGLITTGALTAGVLQSLHGERLGVARLLGIGLRKVFPLFFVSLMVGILVTCGLVLLVVPGLIALAGCYLAVPALVAEQCGTTDALTRSWDLTRNRRWKVLALVLLFSLGVAAVSLGLGAAIGAAAAALTGRVGAGVIGLIEIVAVLTASISQAAPAVAYHDLRIEKEGVSTEQLAAVFE